MSPARCPLHDEHVDPDTGHCDHCERSARLDCDTCGGEGVIVTIHPQWGHIHCPTPELETPCGACRGSGVQ